MNFASQLKLLRKKRGLRQADLADAIGVAQTTIANYEQHARFPDETILLKIANHFNVSLDYLLGRTETESRQQDAEGSVGAAGGSGGRGRVSAAGGSGGRDGVSAAGGSADRDGVSAAGETPPGRALNYLDSLLRGNREEAFERVFDAAAEHLPVRTIYRDVLEPALKETGRLWEAGRIDAAKEHYVSEATEVLMAALYRFLKPRSGNRGAVVSLSVSGEYHRIGMKMISDILEEEGWLSYYLGVNTPTAALIDTLEERKAGVLALSATMEFNMDGVANLIYRVKSSPAVKHVRIIAGGRAFNLNQDLWKKIGADGYAPDLDSAVELVNNL